jgi:hypothetical protein
VPGIKEAKRSTRTRKRRPVVYIICEGTDTEILYFKRFRTRYSNIDIRPFPSQHKSALTLVQHARDVIKQEPYYPEDGDVIWCVFDRDSNTDADIAKAAKRATDYSYNLAFSNPSFELWFLLHFVNQRQPLQTADDVINELNKIMDIRTYSKSKSYFDVLLPNQVAAIKQAHELVNIHGKNGITILSRNSNPCTTVVELVEFLNERIKSGKNNS